MLGKFPRLQILVFRCKETCLFGADKCHTFVTHSFFSNNETCNAKNIVYTNHKSYSCNIHQKYLQYDFFFTM